MSMNFLTITLPSFLSCLPLRFCMWCTWYVNTGVTSYQRFWLCRLQSENIQWRIPKFNHLLFLVVWWNLASPGPRQSLFPASPRAAAARPSRHLGRPVLGGQPRSRRDFGALLVSLNDGSKVRKWWRWQFGYTKRGQKVLPLKSKGESSVLSAVSGTHWGIRNNSPVDKGGLLHLS